MTSKLPHLADTDYDVVRIAMELKAHNGDCGIDEKLACPVCFQTAMAIVQRFRDHGRLAPFGRFIELPHMPQINGLQPSDLDVDDPNIALASVAIRGIGWHGTGLPDRIDAASVAVATLYRYGRLPTPIAA